MRRTLLAVLAVGCGHPAAAAPREAPVAVAVGPRIFVDVAPGDWGEVLTAALTDDPAFTATVDRRLTGFHLSATAGHDIEKHGRGLAVTCTVSIVVATYPSRSMFATLDGAATIPAERDTGAIAVAADECVAAVIRDLVERQVRPTLRRRAGLDGVDSSP